MDEPDAEIEESAFAALVESQTAEHTSVPL